MRDILPGGEPASFPGGSTGVLVVHGFTGTPHSMRPIAEALAGHGHSVELPLLPGHGTTVEDMIKTGFDDWSSHVDQVYVELASRTDRVVVVGLSMGGTLTLWLASRRPELAAIVVINAAAVPDEDTRDGVKAFIESGAEVLDAIRGDIAKPDTPEVAYDQTPLRPLLSLQDALVDLQDHLPNIAMPTLIIVSEQDHVVPPASSDHIASMISSDPQRLTLTDSFHVATLDYDQDRIIGAVVEFVATVAGVEPGFRP